MSAPVIPLEAHRIALDDACITVREFNGGASNKALATLLAAMEQCYLQELVNAPLESIAGIQRSIKQGRALQSLLRGDEHASPLI